MRPLHEHHQLLAQDDREHPPGPSLRLQAALQEAPSDASPHPQAHEWPGCCRATSNVMEMGGQWLGLLRCWAGSAHSGWRACLRGGKEQTVFSCRSGKRRGGFINNTCKKIRASITLLNSSHWQASWIHPSTMGRKLLPGLQPDTTDHGYCPLCSSAWAPAKIPPPPQCIGSSASMTFSGMGKAVGATEAEDETPPRRILSCATVWAVLRLAAKALKFHP